MDYVLVKFPWLRRVQIIKAMKMYRKRNLNLPFDLRIYANLDYFKRCY